MAKRQTTGLNQFLLDPVPSEASTHSERTSHGISLPFFPCPDVGMGGGYFIGSVVYTTQGDGGRSNHGGRARPAEPRER